MWELYCEESWAPKNWCFWTVVLEKTLESPLDCKEIQPVRSKGEQPWVFFGRNDAKAETPVLWPLDAKSWLIGKKKCWERLRAGGEGGDRGWDGASPTWWMWVWVNSRSWWWTGRPGVLRFMGSQRVGHDWATDLIWSITAYKCLKIRGGIWSVTSANFCHVDNSSIREQFQSTNVASFKGKLGRDAYYWSSGTMLVWAGKQPGYGVQGMENVR